MRSEMTFTKELRAGASFAFWMIVFAAFFHFPVIALMTMGIWYISKVSGLGVSGLWIIVGGVVTYVTLLGFIILSLFRRK